jgi:hypothetical protein
MVDRETITAMTTRDRWSQVDFEQVRNLAIIALLAAILFLCSCKTQAPLARTDTVRQVVIKEVLHDTTVYLTDSAGFRALLECDSLGKIRVKQIQDFYSGQFVRPKIVVKDNYVNVGCVIDSGAVYIAWKERNVSESLKTSQTIVQKVNYITGFQWAQIWAGRLLIVLVLIYAGVKVLRRYTGIKV